jgi:hypothetical protein
MPLIYIKTEGYIPSGTAHISASVIDFFGSVPSITLTPGTFSSAGTYVLMRANNYINVPGGFPGSLIGGLTPPGGLTVSSVYQAAMDIVITLV